MTLRLAEVMQFEPYIDEEKIQKGVKGKGLHRKICLYPTRQRYIHQRG